MVRTAGRAAGSWLIASSISSRQTVQPAESGVAGWKRVFPGVTSPSMTQPAGAFENGLVGDVVRLLAQLTTCVNSSARKALKPRRVSELSESVRAPWLVPTSRLPSAVKPMLCQRSVLVV